MVRYTYSFSVGEAKVFRPRERDPRTGLPLTVSQHADRYRVITEGSRQGPWSTDFAPYTRFAMDLWIRPYVRTIILCWGTQTSKTQTALNCLAYAADQDPGHALWIAPDQNKAEDAMLKKIKQMFQKSKRLAELLSPRDRDNTNRRLILRNGMIIQVAWASSASQLAQDSFRYIFFDETDKYVEFTGKEADPISLGEQRVIAFPHTHKIMKISTPSVEEGVIWTAMHNEADEIYDYHVKCIACGHEQVMRFDNFTWPDKITDWRTIKRKKLAYYSCEKCNFKWNDRDRDNVVSKGCWIPRVPVDDGRPATVALHLPKWYSSFVSLSTIVADHLHSIDDPTKEMAFVTQDKAEPYSETVDKKKEEDILEKHCLESLPARTAPANTVNLTCGYDSHKDYFKFTVYAFDQDQNQTLVDYGILGTLDDVETHCFDTEYLIDGTDGDTIKIGRAAIDIGGGKGKREDQSLTEEVKAWIRKMEKKGNKNVVFAIKGASRHQKDRIHFNLIGAGAKGRYGKYLDKQKIAVRILDTDKYKALLHRRIEREEGEKQRFFLHGETREDFVRELLAEELKRDNRGNTYWKKVRNANHYLDCTVYAFAAADSEWLPLLATLPSSRKPGKEKKAPTEQAPVVRQQESFVGQFKQPHRPSGGFAKNW